MSMSCQVRLSPRFKACSTTPQAEVIWETRSMRISEPKALFFSKRSKTMGVAVEISHRAISFL